MGGFIKIIDAFFGAVFPENLTCELCGAELFDGERLCKNCVSEVDLNDGATCPLCGRRYGGDGLCLDCKELAPRFDRAASAIIYKDGGRKLLIDFKNGKTYLKDYFADLLVDKCKTFDADAICFVPMTKRALRRRGYNQAELLAKALGKRMEIPVIKKAIVKKKDTPQQKKLSRKEREENLSACFRADKTLVAGKKIIVVDDILTTGATANAVCAELKKRGAVKTYFVTAASVEYEVWK